MRPRLKPVELTGFTPSGYYEFAQYVDETKSFNGRLFHPHDEWIAGILYSGYLGIAFTERLADLPQFVLQVTALSGQQITSIRGTASKALPGDQLLLGDWIENGTFDPARLARRFDRELGGVWEIRYGLKNPNTPSGGYFVEINQVQGP